MRIEDISLFELFNEAKTDAEILKDVIKDTEHMQGIQYLMSGNVLNKEDREKIKKMSNLRKAYLAGKAVKKTANIIGNVDSAVGGVGKVIGGLRTKNYKKAIKGGVEIGDAVYNGTKDIGTLGMQLHRMNKAQQDEDARKKAYGK